MSFQTLDVDADFALFQGQVPGLIVPFYVNERPLQGLAGLMDWRLRGALSKSIRSGAFDGHEGECVYYPFSKRGQAYHLFLAGAGHRTPYGRRGLVSDDVFRTVKKNLLGLKFTSVGLSKSDFGNLTEDYLVNQLKGVDLWIAR